MKKKEKIYTYNKTTSKSDNKLKTLQVSATGALFRRNTNQRKQEYRDTKCR